MSGRAPTWASVVKLGSPSWTTETSQLVPPISTVIKSPRPTARAALSAATTPDAGPDSTVSIGRARAVSTLTVPPFDAVM